MPPLWWHHRGREKRKPAYDLEAIKAAIGSVETLAITRTALADALALGFNRPGIVLVIQGVRRSMFVKSMTTHADHRVWQDVYHVPADITFPPMACGCTSNSKPTS